MTDHDIDMIIKSAGIELSDIEKDAGIVSMLAEKALPALSKMIKPALAATKTIAKPLTETAYAKGIGSAVKSTMAAGGNWGQGAVAGYKAAYAAKPMLTTGLTFGAGMGAGSMLTPKTKIMQPVMQAPQPQQQTLAHEEIMEIIKCAADDNNKTHWGTIGLAGVGTGAAVAGGQTLYQNHKTNKEIYKNTVDTRGLGSMLDEKDKMAKATQAANFDALFNHITNSKEKKATKNIVNGVINYVGRVGRDMPKAKLQKHEMMAAKEGIHNAIDAIGDVNINDGIKKHLHGVVDEVLGSRVWM